jgi:hypothetical protein
MSSFKKRYPDFASIEKHVRRAHAERAVAIASAIANGIMVTVHGIGQMFPSKAAARTARGGVLVKATVRREAARV